jgi:hypothetical protein
MKSESLPRPSAGGPRPRRDRSYRAEDVAVLTPVHLAGAGSPLASTKPCRRCLHVRRPAPPPPLLLFPLCSTPQGAADPTPPEPNDDAAILLPCFPPLPLPRSIGSTEGEVTSSNPADRVAVNFARKMPRLATSTETGGRWPVDPSPD